jgi:outer membrane lipoprotein-sorting protein
MLPRRGTSLSKAALLFAAVCLAVMVAPASAALRQRAARADAFDDLYRRSQSVNRTLKTLTARFTETTTSSLLTRPLVSHGVVAVERPARVLLRYTDPEVRVVLIDGGQLTISWPGRNIRQVRDIGAAQRRVQKYFVDSSPAELRQHFDIETRETDRPGRAYHLTMVPKRKQIQEGLTGLELWVDQSSELLSAMRMRFPNGDTKLMEFEDVVPNAVLDPSLFTAGR